MGSRRNSIQEAVRVIITRNPYLYRGLRMQVINYSAVARYIRDQVQDMAGAEVDPNTIVTAIMRFSREACREEPPQPEEALHGARFTIHTDVVDIMVRSGPREQAEVLELVSGMLRRGGKVRVFQFPESVRVLATSLEATELMQGLWQYEPRIMEGYAEVAIQLLNESSRFDRIALLTDLLFRHGIHLVDAFYTQDEIVLVIREEDASSAFELLRSVSR